MSNQKMQKSNDDSGWDTQPNMKWSDLSAFDESYMNKDNVTWTVKDDKPPVRVPVQETKQPDFKKPYKVVEQVNPKQQLLHISKLLLESRPGQYNQYEMEVKFGTRGIRPITKMDYDNVVKKLISLGFVTDSENGKYSLKIQPEFLDIKTGEYKNARDFDRFRVEINEITEIQEYCKNNNLSTIVDKYVNQNVQILKKQDVFIDNAPVKSADFNDFNFRVTYKSEESVGKRGKIAQELISNWDKYKKQFRYLNRVSYENPNWPFRVDLSIIRSSTKDNRGQYIKTYNTSESNVFQNPVTYEIEIEVLNDKAQQKYRTAEQLTRATENITKIILSALQKTNYPVSYVEQKQVLSDYMRLVHEDEARKKNTTYEPKARVYSSDFIGPSSKTLQIKNITPVNPDMNIPNITAPYSYCVTDKADGDRHLMLINKSGKIYLISANMDVLFTGAKTEESRYFNTLIDGELILYNKEGVFINTFAAFDIYIARNVSIRERPFIEIPTKEERIFRDGCRLPILKEIMKNLNAISVVDWRDRDREKEKEREESNRISKIDEQFKQTKAKSPMTFITKNFYPLFLDADNSTDEEKSSKKSDSEKKANYDIFGACKFILQRINDGLFEYNTDGLIFTPTIFGVGGSRYLDTGPLKKYTWEYSFKWKPSEFNTIDFLVTTQKGADNNDLITPIFENGINMQKSSQFSQYKTLDLRVGFDEKRHGYINPAQDLLEDNFQEPKDKDKYGENEDTYKPKKFYPSDPVNPLAGVCNVMLEIDPSGVQQMFTEERHMFEDNTIVEFRYDFNRDGAWRWVPLRIRNDKTADFRNGKISCNDYNTANDNWYSIHNPITERMITTGQDIPIENLSDEIYYNRVTTEKRTMGLRDFHNLFVKKLLIQSVSKRGNILIDYACGQGGDFPKWISANLSFVLGIDISKDNIENRISGACARYLNYRKDFSSMPYALFVWGNSSQNVRSGKAAFTDKGSSIIQSVFGLKALDKHLGPAVARQYSKGADGFDVSSCQFALHYMFENKNIFYNFVRNVAECTKQGGYFIGTSYDGKTVFNRLKNKNAGESMEIYVSDRKLWSITKDYDNASFDKNDSSLGYKISVYQDSINQTFSEYLVNYDFFIETMEKYGFKIISLEDAKKMHLPDGTGMFVQLYNKMLSDIKYNPKLAKEFGEAPNMYDFEKDISFLNRYFVFQKIVTYDVEKITKVILEQLPDEFEFEERRTKAVQEAVKKIPKPRVKAVKLKKTLQLLEASEALEERKLEEEQEQKQELEKGLQQELGQDLVQDLAQDLAQEPKPIINESKEGKEDKEEKVEKVDKEEIKKIKQRQTKKKMAAQEEQGQAQAQPVKTTRKKKNVNFDVIE